MNYFEYRAKLRYLGLQSVDDYLDHVTYSSDFIKGYRPSDFALKYMHFCNAISAGDGVEREAPPMGHFIMLDSIALGTKDVANLCHRGFGKTTVVGENLPWYMATFNNLPSIPMFDYMLYVSDSIDNGVKSLRENVDSMYESSPFLREMIPHHKSTEVQHVFINATGVKSYLRCHGILSGVRGTKRKRKRPQLAVMDDLISDKVGDSPASLEMIEKVIYGGIEPALDPKVGRMFFSGTPFNDSDPIITAIESGEWDVNIFPVAEEFPVSEEDFKGGWEERFTWKNLMARYKKAKAAGKESIFMREYMLRKVAEGERLVAESEIQWYSRNILIPQLMNYNIYITTDFAVSEEQKADFSALSVWAVDWAGNFYFLDGIEVQWDLGEVIDNLLSLVRTYLALATGIEITGQQKGFVSWVKRESLRQKIPVNIAKDKNTKEFGIRPTAKKIARFKTNAVPLFKTGKIHYPEEYKNSPVVKSHIDQITKATHSGFKSRNDDCADTISQLGDMTIILPAKSKETYNTLDRLGENTGFTGRHSGRRNYMVD